MPPTVISSKTLVSGPIDPVALENFPFLHGRKLKDASPVELARAGESMKVPGISHENGLQANREAWVLHFRAIGDRASDAAIGAILSAG